MPVILNSVGCTLVLEEGGSMTTSKSLMFPATVVLVVGAAVSANAAPLGWTVDASGPGVWIDDPDPAGPFFSPGEWRATGTFSYDAATGNILDWKIDVGPAGSV